MRKILENKIRNVSPISDHSLSLLLDGIENRQLSKNDFLLKEGQTCKHIFFIEKGCLRTFMHNEEMKEINIHFSFDNTFTTELKSLRTNNPTNCYIQALEDTTIWLFDKDRLLTLYTQSLEISNFGRTLLEQLLMEQEEHANLFKLQTPAERYQFISNQHPEMLQRISQTLLASYLGMSRETLSRIRRQ